MRLGIAPQGIAACRDSPWFIRRGNITVQKLQNLISSNWFENYLTLSTDCIFGGGIYITGMYMTYRTDDWRKQNDKNVRFPKGCAVLSWSVFHNIMQFHIAPCGDFPRIKRCESITWTTGAYMYLNRGGGVLSGKVGTGMCGPDRVLFRPFRFTNGPFFYLKIGLDIGRVFAKCIIFDGYFL